MSSSPVHRPCGLCWNESPDDGQRTGDEEYDAAPRMDVETALQNERNIIATFVDHAPDAFCDLTGARHKDLVERRVIRAALTIRSE